MSRALLSSRVTIWRLGFISGYVYKFLCIYGEVLGFWVCLTSGSLEFNLSWRSSGGLGFFGFSAGLSS